eukprot:307882_1
MNQKYVESFLLNILSAKEPIVPSIFRKKIFSIPSLKIKLQKNYAFQLPAFTFRPGILAFSSSSFSFIYVSNASCELCIAMHLFNSLLNPLQLKTTINPDSSAHFPKALIS